MNATALTLVIERSKHAAHVGTYKIFMSVTNQWTIATIEGTQPNRMAFSSLGKACEYLYFGSLGI